ncbi:MAG: hypothetical protein KME29_31705 [Calothrix sp. FI2-JRJ7]|jgi:hypothetical protein|nr:hypothetical protein [Calothrix sp. FI2-JRJ7]
MKIRSQTELGATKLSELKEITYSLNVESTYDARLKNWIDTPDTRHHAQNIEVKEAPTTTSNTTEESAPSNKKVEAKVKTWANCRLFGLFHNDGSGSNKVACKHHNYISR